MSPTTTKTWHTFLQGVFWLTIFSLFLFKVGNIVAFTKVLTMYQIYYTWIHPPSSFCSSPIPRILSTGIIFYVHTCAHIFALYSPTYPISLPSPYPLPQVPTPHTPGMTHSLFQFCRRKKKKNWIRDSSYTLVMQNYSLKQVKLDGVECRINVNEIMSTREWCQQEGAIGLLCLHNVLLTKSNKSHARIW
jgi:hypothetical protein